MKFFFNLLLITAVSYNAYSLEAVSLVYKEKNSTVEMVKNLLTNKYKIPKNYISELQTTAECTEKNNSVVEICILGDEIKDVFIKGDLFEKFIKQFIEI